MASLNLMSDLNESNQVMLQPKNSHGTQSIHQQFMYLPRAMMTTAPSRKARQPMMALPIDLNNISNKILKVFLRNSIR